MHILLSPDKDGRLSAVYRNAFNAATDLYIASAYLTAWNPSAPLNKKCEQVTFLVGTDFGLTRKAALREVLKWLPQKTPSIFAAVTISGGGFHPKIVAWTSPTGQKFCLVGSSNLSKAAFASNCEANVLLRLSDAEYRRITQWLEEIAKTAEPITKDWIDYHYRESTFPKKTSARHGATASPPGTVVISFSGVPGLKMAVQHRRAQQLAFAKIAKPLLNATKKSASGQMRDSAFWKKFWELWSDHESRFQGSGLQFSCKSANWQQANASLMRILRESKRVSLVQLDHLVMKEIDALEKARNPARGAWLSEVLCHYLPESYPVLNAPVRAWLKHVKWRARRKASEGQRYVDLARQLRYTLRQHPFGAQNMAELDALIWHYAYKKKLLK